MKYLVEQGADIYAMNDYALRSAATNNYLDIAKYLVSQDADIHADNEGVLYWAVEYGHLDVVKYLVGQGADVHIINNWTLRLVKNNHNDVIEYLKSIMKY